MIGNIICFLVGAMFGVFFFTCIASDKQGRFRRIARKINIFFDERSEGI